MNKNLAIGADIGGSHISCAAVDLSTNRVLRETLVGKEVNNQAQAFQIISVWSDAVAETLSKVPADSVKGIGFAMPGPFDYVKGISYIKGVAKYENLYGFNIGDAILSSLEMPEDFGVRFMNDVSGFAVGEATAGKGVGYDRVMCVTLGTGLGSAFTGNKIPIVDGPDVPKLGCVYYIPYEKGIADDYFSTRWFIGKYKELTGKELKGVKELAALAGKDKIADGLFTKFGNDLAVFLAPYLKKFSAEILIIGGNISFAYDRFGSVFEKQLRKEGWTEKVTLSELKEDAALLGSAFLFDESFWRDVQHALPLM
ncbi:MAG TPA: ROK family protein [Bacteroidales bacterium]|nr:ROK family protein [Bacteroidales bacterium]